MATKSKKPAKKKAPAKKAAAPKKIVHTKTVKAKVGKTTVKSKVTTSRTPSRPAGPREQKLASSALKLVDEAAALLRQGIRNSADTSEKNRLAAKKKAHGLLSKATSSLSGLLDGGSSAIHSIIGKI